MAVFNPHPVYFVQAVQSILLQSFADFELIIVEDPSPIRVADLLDCFSDSRIRHVPNAHRSSLIHQKNQGLALAQGEFVAIVDADDISEGDRLLSEVNYLDTHQDIHVVGTQIHLIDDAGYLIGHRRFPLVHNAIITAMQRTIPLSQPSVLLRRQVVLDAGGYQFTDYGVAEDYDLWSRLAVLGAHFANLPDPLLRYRIHKGQLKYTHLYDTIRAVLHIKHKYWIDQMTILNRIYMICERLMLILPRAVVLKLFQILYYRRQTAIALMPLRESPPHLRRSSSPDPSGYRG